jgi:L-fucose isomerase-like protein
MLKVLAEADIDVVCLSPEDSTFGSVETLADAQKCADLFRKHRDDIGGILVTLPNFGDEKAVANAIRWSGLDVPVLVHAFPDDPADMTVANRRDSFCGKLSVCNNLHQYGIKFSLTGLHTVDPESDGFRADLDQFAGVCRVVRGLSKARVGVIGARPAAFNTVRFSEKLFERAGISVETIDLSEVLGRANGLATTDVRLRSKIDEVTTYLPQRDVPAEATERMARLALVIDDWMAENNLVATALQCWTAIEEFYGVTPCTVMSMMSNNLMPSACETDIAGVIGMYALTMAAQQPSALVDWNNNFGDDPDKAVIFHCSNLPKDVFVTQSIAPDDIPVMDYHEILAGDYPKEQTFGNIQGRIRPGEFTFCRVSTDDFNGRITGYVGQGRITNESFPTFGGYGVAKIPNFQRLLHYICENGFEHHVAISLSQTAGTVREALEKYLGWDMYQHH